MRNILAIEQGGNALRLEQQITGYSQLVYKPALGRAYSLGLFERVEDGLAQFHESADSLRQLGVL